MKAISALLDVDRAESAFRLLFHFAVDEVYEGDDPQTFRTVIAEVLRGLRLPEGALQKLERIYRNVTEHPAQLQQATDQVVRDFGSKRALLLALVSLLLRLTAVDGMISRRHSVELKDVLRAFNISSLDLDEFDTEEQILLSYVLYGKTPSSGWTENRGARELAHHYETLGCRPDSSDNELRQAYRTLAKKFHPDRQEPELKKKAAERFRAIQAAYEAVCKARS